VIANNSVDSASKKLSYPKELVEVLAKQEQFFKLFIGDTMTSYPHGKSYLLQDFKKASKEFQEKSFSPTGLLCGAKAKRSRADARVLEEKFDDEELYNLKGDRRYAWIWVENLAFSYNKTKRELRVQFYLPKGSYATTLLEEIAKRSLKS
jgi:tRNA pseudouridine13 synthase